MEGLSLGGHRPVSGVLMLVILVVWRPLCPSRKIDEGLAVPLRRKVGRGRGAVGCCSRCAIDGPTSLGPTVDPDFDLKRKTVSKFRRVSYRRPRSHHRC